MNFEPDGVVANVCKGTGIQSTAAKYYTRGTQYLLSGPGGVGTVLWALQDYDDWTKLPTARS